MDIAAEVKQRKSCNEIILEALDIDLHELGGFHKHFAEAA